MTVDQMIAQLTELRDAGNPGTDTIVAWDPDAEGYYPVSGFIFGAGNVIELQTDEV